MREETIRKVCVLFKTHFDYGYTALARDVYDRYMNQYIPAALSRAEEMRAEGEHRFIWTTGSWLIDEYLRQADDENHRRMERAIEAGDVRWHGLPFTTHTELMDRELFEYGISISKELDNRFHMHTTAAKLTDVPGHTCAIIDLLADAEIRFLHIGDNPTSRPPEVPELFVWRAPSGKELDVMLYKIFLPLALPSLATVTLFAIIGHWNAFFDGAIYINTGSKKPLQTYLQTLIVDQTQFTNMTPEERQRLEELTSKNFNAAKLLVSIVPIMVIYPFLQRYFVTGLVLGSVKG